MRLPADAVLIIIDAPETIDPGKCAGEAQATRNIAALIAAWRAEELPLVHVHQLTDGASPAGAAGDNEFVIVRSASSAFVGANLEARLDELGATTLVFCGALAGRALEASARHADDLGYQVFVVADACQASETVDGKGTLAAASMRAMLRTTPHGEGATIVDAATALRAASTAKARQSRGATRT